MFDTYPRLFMIFLFKYYFEVTAESILYTILLNIKFSRNIFPITQMKGKEQNIFLTIYFLVFSLKNKSK